MLLGEAHESHQGQRLGRECLVHVTRTSAPPRSPTVKGGCGCAVHVDTTLAEFAESSPWSLPLTPHDAAQFPTNSLVEVFEDAFYLQPLEVRSPSPNNGRSSRMTVERLPRRRAPSRRCRRACTRAARGTPRCRAARRDSRPVAPTPPRCDATNPRTANASHKASSYAAESSPLPVDARRAVSSSAFGAAAGRGSGLCGAGQSSAGRLRRKRRSTSCVIFGVRS